MDISTVIVGLAGFGAAALAVDRPASPAVAKLCFFAAAVLTAGAAIFWGSETTLSPAARIGVTGVMSAVIGIALIESLRWASPSPTKPSSMATHRERTPNIAPAASPALNIPSVSETLAREQLADLRNRQSSEREATRRAMKQKQDDAENDRRRKISETATAQVDRLRGEYLNSHDGVSSAMQAGTEPVPDDWMNTRLKELSVRWTYAGQPGGGYTLAPGPNAFEK